MSEHDSKDRPDDDDDDLETEEDLEVESEAVYEEFPADLDAVPRVISVFPLQNTVLFPRVSLPLHIFEERYKAMVADALEQDRAIAIALTDEDDRETGAREVCSAGVITRVESLEDGEKNIVVTGVYRCRIIEVVERRPYLVARVAPLEERGNDARLQTAVQNLRNLAIQWIFFQDQDSGQEMIRRVSLLSKPGHLADFLAFHLFEDASLKQEVLESIDVQRRLARVHGLVQTALERLQAEKKI